MLQGLRYAGGKRVVPSSFGARLPDQEPDLPTDTVRLPVRPATARLLQRPRDTWKEPRRAGGPRSARSGHGRPPASRGAATGAEESSPPPDAGDQTREVVVKSPRPWGDLSRAVRASALESAGGEIRVKEQFAQTWREELEAALTPRDDAS